MSQIFPRKGTSAFFSQELKVDIRDNDEI